MNRLRSTLKTAAYSFLLTLYLLFAIASVGICWLRERGRAG
jgi:hypothetical protein